MPIFTLHHRTPCQRCQSCRCLKSWPIIRETLSQCCFNFDPPSSTMPTSKLYSLLTTNPPLLLIQIVILFQALIIISKMIYHFSISHKKAFAKMLEKLNANKVCGPDNLSYPVQPSWPHQWNISLQEAFTLHYNCSIDTRSRGGCS